MKNDELVFESKKSRFWSEDPGFYAVFDSSGNLKVKESNSGSKADEALDYSYAGYPIRIIE